jgi:hypothetical protein
MSSTKTIAPSSEGPNSNRHATQGAPSKIPTIIAPTDTSSASTTLTSFSHSSDAQPAPELQPTQTTNRETTSERIWHTPHSPEYQKREWYHASLGMGTKQVTDAWGFSSAAASRSHSPWKEGISIEKDFGGGGKGERGVEGE